jgi:DMSO/TMAO reductase YedYZ heme-binding membrane subunit
MENRLRQGETVTFLITLVITIALAFLLRKPLKKAPLAFYALAVVACVVSLWLFSLPATERPALLGGLYFIMRRGYVALSLFTVTMFIGVFNENSSIRRALNPVRAEYSIIAAILIVGHIVPYLISYLQQLMSPLSLRGNIAVSLALSCVLFFLLVLLTVTSFTVVRQHMRSRTWKNLQRLAYLFFLLIYAHLAGFLLPAALQGSPIALTNMAIYSVLFVSYAILRVHRSLSARRRTLAHLEAT